MEEKKAIEVIKGLAVYYDDYSLLDEEEIEENEEVNNSINIVINLIEKQSKEIEELKEDRRIKDLELKKQDKEIEELKSQIDEHVYNGCDYELCNKKWQDKIKAKMKEKEWSLENYDCNESDYKQSQAIGAWSVLQSLLEKE